MTTSIILNSMSCWEARMEQVMYLAFRKLIENMENYLKRIDNCKKT
jgi:adenylosuccinate synthase